MVGFPLRPPHETSGDKSGFDSQTFHWLSTESHRVWLNNGCGHARRKAEVGQAVVAAKEYRETGAL